MIGQNKFWDFLERDERDRVGFYKDFFNLIKRDNEDLQQRQNSHLKEPLTPGELIRHRTSFTPQLIIPSKRLDRFDTQETERNLLYSKKKDSVKTVYSDKSTKLKAFTVNDSPYRKESILKNKKVIEYAKKRRNSMK